MEKVDGIKMGKNSKKGGPKKSVEKTWKKLYNTVGG
jgi:hypothetical protein